MRRIIFAEVFIAELISIIFSHCKSNITADTSTLDPPQVRMAPKRIKLRRWM
jgi:hypothetical protein